MTGRRGGLGMNISSLSVHSLSLSLSFFIFPCFWHDKFCSSRVFAFLLRRFVALAAAWISAPHSHRDQSQVTPAFKSRQLWAVRQPAEFQIWHGGDISYHPVLLFSFITHVHSLASLVPECLLSCASCVFLVSPAQLWTVSCMSLLHIPTSLIILLLHRLYCHLHSNPPHIAPPPTPASQKHTFFLHSRKSMFLYFSSFCIASHALCWRRHEGVVN